jgi:hypothetical protein
MRGVDGSALQYGCEVLVGVTVEGDQTEVRDRDRELGCLVGGISVDAGGDSGKAMLGAPSPSATARLRR